MNDDGGGIIYPALLARVLPVAVFSSLLLLAAIDQPLVQGMAVSALCAAAVVYAGYSIRLLSQRKRKIPDVTVRFWRLSLACLILAALLQMGFYFADEVLFPGEFQYRVPVVIGVLMIYGFAISVIMGMLQKIVPFLSYLHLQRHCLGNFEQLKTLPHRGKSCRNPVRAGSSAVI